jgi:hypothetical protein
MEYAYPSKWLIPDLRTTLLSAKVDNPEKLTNTSPFQLNIYPENPRSIDLMVSDSNFPEPDTPKIPPKSLWLVVYLPL